MEEEKGEAEVFGLSVGHVSEAGSQLASSKRVAELVRLCGSALTCRQGLRLCNSS